MKLEDIHVGDILKVRGWDDMVSEYGEDSHGDIRVGVGIWFAKPMRYLCGRVFTVNSISRYGTLHSAEGIEFEADPLNPEDYEWAITASMLELYFLDLTEPEEDYSTIDLSEFLS